MHRAWSIGKRGRAYWEFSSLCPLLYAVRAQCESRLSGVFKKCVYLREVAQHQISLSLVNGADYELKAFELNPRKRASQTGRPVDVWVEPESVIVTAPAAAAL